MVKMVYEFIILEMYIICDFQFPRCLVFENGVNMQCFEDLKYEKCKYFKVGK